MKVKRLLALILALTLAVAVFAIPVSAAQPDTEHPDASIYCPRCSKYGTASVVNSGSYTYNQRVDTCQWHNGTHNHTLIVYYTNYVCTNCGSFEVSTYPQFLSCPYQ